LEEGAHDVVPIDLLLHLTIAAKLRAAPRA